MTFAVKQSWRMPDLAGLVPAGGAVEDVTDELEAVYYDTPPATLRRLGITLRRRTGGSDAGWHLKVTEGATRTEFQSRARTARVPEPLTRRLAGIIDGQELSPVGTIATTRHATRLLDPEGTLLAEVADDQVNAVAVGNGDEPDHWREVEVELGPGGDEALLRRITKLFAKADAAPAPVQRKLDRLLGPFTAGAEDGARDRGKKKAGTRSAHRAVAAYVQDQAREILLGDVALRDRPKPETVHRTRVAIRRLRSTLRTFRPAFALDDEAAARLDQDLRWLAGLLGPIRDGDILARRLAVEVAELPPERVLGPVVREIEETLAAERSAAIEAWQAAGTDERYRALVATLTGWLVEVPLGDTRVDGQAVLDGARRTAERRRRRAQGDPEALHQARKAAKRMRYAAELLDGVVPKAAKTVLQAKQQQTVLGDHQDLMVAAEFLQRQGSAAGSRAGHNGFTYGLLLARVDEKAARIRAGL